MLAAGEIDYKGFIELVASSAPSTGYCNTMGTATTMNSLTEALGMSLPGSAAIPAPYRDRQQSAWETGRQIVEMVAADRRPSDILTRDRVSQRDPSQFGDRRIDQCADPSERDRPPCRRRADARRLGELRRRHPADRQSSAGGRISGRGLLPRGRRSGGDGPVARGRADSTGSAHRQWPHSCR